MMNVSRLKGVTLVVNVNDVSPQTERPSLPLLRVQNHKACDQLDRDVLGEQVHH